MRILFTILLIASGYLSLAQNYIIIHDPTVIRGSFGAARPLIETVNNTIKRDAYAINIGIQSRFLSHILKQNEGFALTDGIYADVFLGAMTSEKLKVFNTEETGFFCFGLTAGYYAMAGYSANRLGFLAGPKFNFQKMMIGETTIPDGFQRATCLQGRIEWRIGSLNEFRLQLTAWSNFNNERMQRGARFDIPVGKVGPSFIFFEYNQMQAEGVYPHTFSNLISRMTMLNIGWRFGSIY